MSDSRTRWSCVSPPHSSMRFARPPKWYRCFWEWKLRDVQMKLGDIFHSLCDTYEQPSKGITGRVGMQITIIIMPLFRAFSRTVPCATSTDIVAQHLVSTTVLWCAPSPLTWWYALNGHTRWNLTMFSSDQLLLLTTFMIIILRLHYRLVEKLGLRGKFYKPFL